MSTLGLDVSQYQETTPPLAGLSFLFARSSIGLRTDTMYARHISAARRAGLVVGAYHFAYDTIPMEDQVRLFLHAAGDVDLYAVDVEGAHAPSRAQTAAFIRAMHAAGKRCGLYHSASGFFDAGQDFDWVAKWGSTPPASWDFWQNRGSPLDLDRYAGSPGQLLAFARGIDLTPPESSTGDPMSIYTRRETPGTFALAAGAVVRAWEPTTDGWRVAKTWQGHGPSGGTFDAVLSRTSGSATPSNLVHCVGGFFDDLYVATSEIAEVLDPAVVAPPTADTTPFNQAALDAAKAEGYTGGLADGKVQGTNTEKARLRSVLGV